jgi:phenylpyruvate tautomerase PptA (4-oxalocrotonate tautomerase family)
MPLVKISCHYERYTAAEKTAIPEAVYLAMRETLGIPEGDRFIVLSEHEKDELSADPGFPGMSRSEGFVLIQITLSKGRTVEQKQALYAQIAERLQGAARIAADDVMIVLTENRFEDWSFGKGEAQYVLNPPAWAAKLKKETESNA